MHDSPAYNLKKILIIVIARRLSRTKLAFHLLHEKEGKITRRMWSKERRKEWLNDMLGGMHGTSWWCESRIMSRETLQKQATAQLWLFKIPSKMSSISISY